MLDLDSWPHTPHGVLLLTLLLGLPGEHVQENNHTSCVKGKVLTQDSQGQVLRPSSQDKDLFNPEGQRLGITDNDRKQRKKGEGAGIFVLEKQSTASG